MVGQWLPPSRKHLTAFSANPNTGEQIAVSRRLPVHDLDGVVVACQDLGAVLIGCQVITAPPPQVVAGRGRGASG